MKTFSISTLGCKVNQYESQQIRQLLEQLGLTQVETADKPDLAVVNTCCVTHIASAKSRQCIRRAKQLSSNSAVVVTGCLSAVQIGELNNIGESVHVINQQDTMPAQLSQIVSGKTPHPDSLCVGTYRNSPKNTIRTKNGSKSKREVGEVEKLPKLTAFKGQTRAFLKVQDGCDGYCSYCIIPQARPVVGSKPIEQVLDEAQALVKAGHKEIVVTGIFLGAFGQQTVRRNNWLGRSNNKLADLVDKLAKIEGLARIRLSSLEPGDVTERLIDVFCRHRNIMPHLHLSLQSGCDAVLRKMGRQYRIDEFRKKLDLIKSRLDRPAITTDLIVGFPGETESDFEQTVALAKEVGFAKIHVFSYSARKGTAAAKMQDTVNTQVMKQRSVILRQLDIELGCKFRQQFVGEEVEVLVENVNGEVSGRCERYFVVSIKNPPQHCKKNDLVRVKLVETCENGVVGFLAK